LHFFSASRRRRILLGLSAAAAGQQFGLAELAEQFAQPAYGKTFEKKFGLRL
jgi:hypothetical protein